MKYVFYGIKKLLNYPFFEPYINFILRVCVFFGVLINYTEYTHIFLLYYFNVVDLNLCIHEMPSKHNVCLCCMSISIFILRDKKPKQTQFSFLVFLFLGVYYVELLCIYNICDCGTKYIYIYTSTFHPHYELLL